MYVCVCVFRVSYWPPRFFLLQNREFEIKTQHTEKELELLLCGIPVIDVSEWKRHSRYLGEYRRTAEDHRVIKVGPPLFLVTANGRSKYGAARLKREEIHPF